MNIDYAVDPRPTLKITQRVSAGWPLCLLLAAWPATLPAQQNEPEPASTLISQPPYAQQAPDRLDQLVAPIALYPDALVAQILAGSTFPAEIVEAERWVQVNPQFKDGSLAAAVDQQPWDPSVKALAAFPTVLGNMDKNLAWTSSLGDAYYNQQQGVMDAVQEMRRRAEAAGNLRSTPQQTVATRDASIVIQPVSPEVVYVPAYDPWLVYGDPVMAWPGWYPYPGLWEDGPYLSVGIGFGIGFWGGFGWGWGNWGFDWHNRFPLYDHQRYFSRSNTFYNRQNYYRSGGYRGIQSTVSRASGGHAGYGGHDFDVGRGADADHGAFAGLSDAESRGGGGVRSSAFSGYDHGGQARSFSSRGSASFGGGHGGGMGHGGGRRR